MNKTILCAVTTFGLLGGANPASADPPYKDLYKFKGHGAWFHGTGEDECRFFTLTLDSSEGLVHEGKGKPTTQTFAWFSFWVYDQCQGIFWEASWDVAPQSFGADLDAASLLIAADVPVRVCDGQGECGDESLYLELAVEWTGTGPLAKQTSTSTAHSRDTVYRSHSSSTSRDAAVSATLALDGEALSLQQLTGTLRKDSSGWLQIYRVVPEPG